MGQIARVFYVDFNGRCFRRVVVNDSIDQTALKFPFLVFLILREKSLDGVKLNDRNRQFEWVSVLEIHRIDEVLFFVLFIKYFELNFHLIGGCCDSFQFVIF